MKKLATHASDEFNVRLGQSLDGIAKDCREALQDNLCALILGGGYGRSEGGVVKETGIEMPYNDFDFTIIVKDPEKIPDGALKEISEKYEPILKIDVDFSRPLTVKDVQNWPHILMWQDLLNGHIVIDGPEDILEKNAPANLRDPLPVIEASKLTLNRGAGLLWAILCEQNIEKLPDKDFIRRNYYKTALAIGDALLIAYKMHKTPYTGRDVRLIKLAEKEKAVEEIGITPLYTDALEFKFRPDSFNNFTPQLSDLKALSELWKNIFLHIESLRTNRKWSSVAEYSAWSGIREPNQNSINKWPRNIIQNLRYKKLSLKYPREGLFRKIPILLCSQPASTESWINECRIFMKVWDKFN